MVWWPSPTFDGPNTQNETWALTNLTSTAPAFIPTYGQTQQHMTEGIGCGIIMSIITAQFCQQYLRRTGSYACSWLATCTTYFVYTVTVVMMGTSSAIFNPAVLFGWALLGRTAWGNWIKLSLTMILGSFAGVLCPPPAVPPAPTLPQFYAQLNRVPIPRRGPDGRWLYMQLRFRWSMVFPTRLRVWGPADELPAASAPVPAWQGGKAWAGVLLPHDAAPVSAGGAPPSTPPPPAPADAEAAANKLAGSGSADGDDSVLSEWLEAGWTAEEARLAATPEFQAEVVRDRHAKLSCFAETPTIYSRFWLAQIWPHIMAGTTLVHWLSFMTGNATQLTNTNVYLVQPVNAPGQQYSFQNAVLIAWLMGLAYFLLTGTAGSTCNLQLNPASDLGGRIAYTLLPIANKGHAGWSYAWVPTFMPFVAASIGAGIMYMSM
ncbi:hypothetical protein COHA_009209 [Chlorella ohadii]|uniref:Uncharacterized protein n=1 Tax=Chlorella ohadii TaxID=2649997 RepID=A0AAD5H1S1_9CHLO|nr:hypothetical protein COHA_009209 [Chlorella ohadii]